MTVSWILIMTRSQPHRPLKRKDNYLILSFAWFFLLFYPFRLAIILRNAGLNIDNAWIRIDEFISSMSNYVIDSRVFYNGPVQYMPK